MVLDLRSVVLMTVVLTYLFSDMLTRVTLADGFSINAALSLATFSIFLTIFPFVKIRNAISVPGSLWVFSLWLLISLFWSSDPNMGIQQVIVWILFVMAMVLGNWSGERREIWDRRKLFVAIALMWSIMMIIFKQYEYRIGEFQIIGPRTTALVAIIGFSVSYGDYVIRRSIKLLFIWMTILLAVAISESRMAILSMFLAVVLTEMNQLKTNNKIMSFKYLILSLVVILAIFVFNDPLRNRIESTIANIMDIVSDPASGRARTLTQGRSYAWTYIYESAWKEPFLGHGAGSSSVAAFDVTRNERFGHAHNEYLRFLHDTGIVGVVLFVIGMGKLWLKTTKKVNVADRLSSRRIIAMCLVTTFILMGITDNIAMYSFVVVPAGFIVGMGMACEEFHETKA